MLTIIQHSTKFLHESPSCPSTLKSMHWNHRSRCENLCSFPGSSKGNSALPTRCTVKTIRPDIATSPGGHTYTSIAALQIVGSEPLRPAYFRNDSRWDDMLFKCRAAAFEAEDVVDASTFTKWPFEVRQQLFHCPAFFDLFSHLFVNSYGAISASDMWV